MPSRQCYGIKRYLLTKTKRMKFYNLKMNAKKALTAVSLCLALGFMASCDDDDTPQPSVAALSIFHASPNADSVNITIDAQKLNTKPVGFMQGLGYFNALAGERVIEVSTKDGKSVLKKAVSITEMKYYSLFLANTKEAAEYVLVTDTTGNPASGKAKVRFINLSHDGDKLSLAKTGEQPLFTDEAFKTATKFVEIDGKKASFDVMDASKKVIATLKDQEIVAGGIYTIWVGGSAKSTVEAEKIRAKLFTNAKP